MSLETISRKAATMSLNARQLHTDPTPATITPLSDSSSFPIPTYTLTRTLDGVQTDLLIQSYEDRVFVMITQVGKMGFLVSVHRCPASFGQYTCFTTLLIIDDMRHVDD